MMDKKFLQRKLLDIYAKEHELTEIDFVPNEWWKQLLDRATDLLEKVVKNGIDD